MEVARLLVDGTFASVVMRRTITAGLVGATVLVEYAPGIWDGLTKTVVFKGSETKDNITNETTVEIPWEVLQEPSRRLHVGFFGVDADGKQIIPTIWADLGPIYPGADPSGDTSTDPGLPVWGQIADKVEKLSEEVDELKQGGGPGTPGMPGADGEDGGYYTPAVTQLDEDTIQFAFTGSKEGMPAVDPVTVELPVGQGSGGNVDYVGVEPADDDIPKIFFGGALQQTKDEKVVPFRYISKTDDFSGYAEIKAQGNSSMSYPKKNQTVKMFKDSDCTEKMKVDFKGWGKQNKHVYKANWIDLSHARNVVSARLWADVVKSRANYAELPELFRTTPNQGAVDGFPVKVYAAGVYQGRYTLNIPKDKWTFNMDDELNEHCALCGENYASGCFRAAANINGNDWTDEIHDVVPASIKTRWNEVISFVMNSTDDEFRANLSQYFYVDSLIDYYLFGLASCGLDAFGKNQIYATYDGQKWIASMYDMDSTWGLYWNGSKFVATDYGRDEYEDYVHTDGNLLYNRLEQLFWSELQTRWAELKNGALSIVSIINRFERFMDIAPAELVKEDYASTTGGGKFTGIPSQATNNIQQIRAFALARQAWTDEYVASLTPEVEVPCTGISLNTNTLTFTAEGSQTLTATVTPDGCTDPVTWESNNTSVATVNGGVVTAIANGSATITAKCGEYSASCSVAVSGIAEGVPCTGITLDKTELTFGGEGTQIITATVMPSDTTDTVVWVSSAPAVASITVEGNVCTVQSVSNGNAVITVTCGEYSASCSVSVSGIDATLLYSLSKTTFDGVDDYIDTGIKLFDTPKDFTLFVYCNNIAKQADKMRNVFDASAGLSMFTYTNLYIVCVDNIELPKVDPAEVFGVVMAAQQGIITKVKMVSVNGVVNVDVPDDVVYTASDSNLFIGCNVANKNYWKGNINRVQVWNTALSEEEIDANIAVISNETLFSDYSPAGAKFGDFAIVDFNAGSYIEAGIDLANCSGTSENLLSVGKLIEKWKGNSFHFYYTKATGTLEIDANSSTTASIHTVTIDGDRMIVRFDKNGLTLNGTLLTARDFNDPTPYNAVMSSLLAQNVIAIGSVEGKTRSNATYNYIRVGVDA